MKTAKDMVNDKKAPFDIAVGQREKNPKFSLQLIEDENNNNNK